MAHYTDKIDAVVYDSNVLDRMNEGEMVDLAMALLDQAGLPAKDQAAIAAILRNGLPSAMLGDLLTDKR